MVADSHHHPRFVECHISLWAPAGENSSPEIRMDFNAMSLGRMVVLINSLPGSELKYGVNWEEAAANFNAALINRFGGRAFKYSVPHQQNAVFYVGLNTADPKAAMKSMDELRQFVAELGIAIA